LLNAYKRDDYLPQIYFQKFGKLENVVHLQNLKIITLKSKSSNKHDLSLRDLKY